MRLGLGISMFTQSSPPPSEGGGGEPYAQSVIAFDGSASLSRGANLTGASNGPMGYVATWFEAAPGFTVIPVLDNQDQYARVMVNNDESVTVQFADEAVESLVIATTTGSAGIIAGRNLLIVAWNTNFESGSRRLAVYVNDVSIPYNWSTDTGVAFDIFYNSGNVWMLQTPDFLTASKFSDTGLWLGSTIVEANNTITEVNRRKFIDASGDPVDPTSWPANPTVKFDGNAASFATNDGSGGAFSVAGGSISNAAWS